MSSDQVDLLLGQGAKALSTSCRSVRELEVSATKPGNLGDETSWLPVTITRYSRLFGFAALLLIILL